MKHFRFFDGIKGDWYIHTPSEESYNHQKVLYVNTTTIPVGDSTDPVEILQQLIFDTLL